LELKAERIFVIKENVSEQENKTAGVANEKTGGSLKELREFVGRD
jgi:hypothetical protein